MFGQIYSNRIIRKIITSFGALFTNLTVVRTNNVTNQEVERFLVPVQFAEKEKYIQILTGDPTNTKAVQINLPIISFDLKGIRYDQTRKQQSTLQNFTQLASGNVSTQYIPSPWNFEFDIIIYIRNIEDGTQIVEQILPYFAQDYTTRINFMPTINITKDVPVILNNVQYEVYNEGDSSSETRILMWTLSFTVKGWLFGPVNTSGLIQEAIVNIYDTNVNGGKDIILVLNTGGTGNYVDGEIVYQGNTFVNTTATATVSKWYPVSGRLVIQQPTGLFITNQILNGSQSDAQYSIQNYEIIPLPLETIKVTPNPTSANLQNNLGFITTVTQTV